MLVRAQSSLHSALKWGRCNAYARMELVVVVMCGNSMTFSQPLPRTFHQLYPENVVPLIDENDQDRSDLSSSSFFGRVVDRNPKLNGLLH